MKMAANPEAIGPQSYHKQVHDFYPACLATRCWSKDPVKDAGEWAYCEWCAFEVPADKVEGKLMLSVHGRAVGESLTRRECGGSGTEASAQPGPEAKPKPLWYTVDLEDEDDGDDTGDE